MKVIQIIVLLLAALVVPSCGEGKLGALSLNLDFAPRDLPDETTAVQVLVLPHVIFSTETNTNETLVCSDFVGETAQKKIAPYISYAVADSTIALASDGGSVTVSNLEEGSLLFYVRALDGTSQVLAFGCGEGEIQKGEKTFIAIRLTPGPE
jgi:hypothetical protein